VLKVEQSTTNGVVTYKMGTKIYVADGKEHQVTGGSGSSAWTHKHTNSCEGSSLQSNRVELLNNQTMVEEELKFFKEGPALVLVAKRTADGETTESKMVCDP
jgi:hypothetical protein